MFLRGPVWWYQFNVNGQQVRVSTELRGGSPGNPPKEVQLWVARKLVELAKGAPAKAESVTFNQIADALVARYRAENRPTLPNLINRLRPLRAYFGERKAVSITTSDMAAYLAHRRDHDGAAVATCNLEKNFASRAFAVAVEDRVLQAAPKFRALPGSRVRQGIIEEEAFKQIVSLMPEELRAYTWFLRLTGWRRSEPSRLRWANVSWEAQDLLLLRSKTDRPRRLPFKKYAALHSLLLMQRAYCDEIQKRGIIVEWVFPRADGKQTKDDALYRAWVKARMIAGYPKAIPHDLRRSVARKGELTHTARGVTMALMGVTTQAVFQRYAILTQTDLEDGLGQFSEANEPQTVIAFSKPAARKP